MFQYGEIGYLLQGRDEVFARLCEQYRLLPHWRKLYWQSDRIKYGNEQLYVSPNCNRDYDYWLA